MSALLLLAPIFMLFEVGQLYLSERYLGVKQIARGTVPRALGLGEFTSFCWSAGLILYWLWMLALLTISFVRVHGLCLLGILGLGYSVRRNCRLSWVLVVLTLEGAIRIGLLVSLCALAWRKL
jgi:hypothetical protein